MDFTLRTSYYERHQCWLRLMCLMLYVFVGLMESESSAVMPNATLSNVAQGAQRETTSSESLLLKYRQQMSFQEEVPKVGGGIHHLRQSAETDNQNLIVKKLIGDEESKDMKKFLRNIFGKYISSFKSSWYEPLNITHRPKQKKNSKEESELRSLLVDKSLANEDLSYSRTERKVRHSCHCRRHFHSRKLNCSHSWRTNEEDEGNTFPRLDKIFEGLEDAYRDNNIDDIQDDHSSVEMHITKETTKELLFTEIEDIAIKQGSSTERRRTVRNRSSGRLTGKSPWHELKYTLHDDQFSTSYKNLNHYGDRSASAIFKKSLARESHILKPLLTSPPTTTSAHPLEEQEPIVQNLKSTGTLKKPAESTFSLESQEAINRVSLNLLHNPVKKEFLSHEIHSMRNDTRTINISRNTRTAHLCLENISHNEDADDEERSHPVMVMSSSSSSFAKLDRSRDDLIKRFKMSHPLKSWETFGLFNDHFLEKVDSHWLSYEPASQFTHKLLGVAYTILMTIGVGGNLLVILMFIRCRSLRTPPNYLIVNLAISDCLMMLKMPIFIVNSAHSGPVLGLIGCRIYGFVGGLSGTVSIMTLSAIAVDRYTVIAYPLNPMKRTTSSKALGMVGAVWIYSTFFACLPIFGVNGYVPEGYLTSCSFDYLSPHTSDRVFVFIYFLAAFVVPLSLIVFSYVKIFRTVHTSEREEMFNPVNTKGIVLLGRESFKCKRDTKKQKTEMKIAMLSSTIIIVWLVAWTPYAVVSLLGIFGYKRLLTPLASAIPSLFCKTAGCIDPFLYAIKHPRFQRELRAKLPCFMCCGNHRNGSNGNKSSPNNSYSLSGTQRDLLQLERPSHKIRQPSYSSMTSTPLPHRHNCSRLGAGGNSSSSSSPAHLAVTLNLRETNNGSRVTTKLLRNPNSISKHSLLPVKSSLKKESYRKCQCRCKKKNMEQGFNLNFHKTDFHCCNVCCKHSHKSKSELIRNGKCNFVGFELDYYGSKKRSEEVFIEKLCNNIGTSLSLESQVNDSTDGSSGSCDLVIDNTREGSSGSISSTTFTCEVGRTSKFFCEERKECFTHRECQNSYKKINVLSKEGFLQDATSTCDIGISRSQGGGFSSDVHQQCSLSQFNLVSENETFFPRDRIPYETTII